MTLNCKYIWDAAQSHLTLYVAEAIWDCDWCAWAIAAGLGVYKYMELMIAGENSLQKAIAVDCNYDKNISGP